MILSFSVENFRSIRDRQTLVFEATKDTTLSERNVINTQDHRLLKCAALYGANASGKSSVLDAMIRMRSLLLTSVSENLEEASLPADPFLLNTQTQKDPTDFEIEILLNNNRYRYGFSFDQNEIQEEWLYRKRPKIREAKLFSRENQIIDINTSQFKEAKGLDAKTRNDVLFLRTCAEWNTKLAEIIVEWFRKFRHVSGISETGFFSFTAKQLETPEKQAAILNLSKKADFNIQDIQPDIETLSRDDIVDDMPEALKKRITRGLVTTRSDIQTFHHVFDNNGKVAGSAQFDLRNDESQGTCKFVALSGPIEHTLEEGSILVIDEFEARLHPNLTKALLEYFLGPNNKNGAQLIFATHDTGLMVPELLRRDQIWFCEKDDQGASSLYSLDEFDSSQVRPNTRFDRQYLQGIFGAVPNVALNEI